MGSKDEYLHGRVLACVIARTTSSRLPLKVLRDVQTGTSVLDLLVERLKRSKLVDEICICTSSSAVDDILEDVARRNNVGCYRGSETDIVDRMLGAADLHNAKYVVRATGDNPLISTDYLDRQIEVATESKSDYARAAGLPLGMVAEVISVAALKEFQAIYPVAETEYLFWYMFNPRLFTCNVVLDHRISFDDRSVTIDTPEDLTVVRNILKGLTPREASEMQTRELLRRAIPICDACNASSTGGMGEVKLPGGVTIPIREFRAEVKSRLAGATIYEL